MQNSDESQEAVTAIDVYASGHLDPPFSHLLIWPVVWVWLVCVGLCLLGRKRHQKLAKAADEAVNAQDDKPLWAGQRYLSGVVEYAADERMAVDVRVTQRGSEHKTKHGWKHKWTEISRSTEARPFYVRLNSKERVRVEPGHSVFLVDDPDGMVWEDKFGRMRVARLSPGERVVVEGTLAKGPDPEQQERGGYRGAEPSWVMRPLRDGKMHISAEPLGHRHRLRAEMFASSARMIAFVGLVLHAVMSTYYTRLFVGETVIATVKSKDHYTTKGSKGQITHHYRVFVNLPSPGAITLDRELNERGWKAVDKGFPMYYRDVTEWRWASMPGRGVSSSSAQLICVAILGLIAVALYGSAAGHKMWYEGRLDDSGHGKLPDPPVIKT